MSIGMHMKSKKDLLKSAIKRHILKNAVQKILSQSYSLK